MAKILFTAFLADARNKLNGNVFSKNRYGAYIRNKVTPVNPQTSFQQAQRQMLGSLSAQWRGITEAQRDSWSAATAAFPRTDIFGRSQQLAANALFVSLNKNLINAGQSTIDAAPSPVSIPTLALSALTLDSATPAMSFNIDQATVPAGFSLFVKTTGNVSAGKDYVKNLLRFIGTETAALNVVDILADWQARFGTLVAGQKITVEAFYVSNTTGQAGVPVSISGIVQ